MKYKSRVLVLEMKNFVQGKTVGWAIVCLVIFGLYSFYHGASVIGHQIDTISSIPTVQNEHLKHVAEEGKGKTVGTTAYYPFFYTFNNPSPLAAFSIGQRDVNAFSLKVKILGIEGQLYDSELTNPLTLLVGNLDASFVFLFLFPLLIIAFTYNTISQEQESGVWKIVRTSTDGLVSTMLIKLMVRLAIVLLAFVLVFLLGVVTLNLPLTVPTFQMGVVLLVYELFWFLLSVLIVSLGKSSSFNATTLVSAWIFLCILFPGIANVLISGHIKIPEALETSVKQREGYHAKWDLPKKPTMALFYQDYPQYRKYPIPEDAYSPGWYYAMQYAGEVESRESARQLLDKLAQRQQLATAIARFDPVIATQQMLNRIARTDLDNHIAYLQSVRAYHKKLREFFYPYIFEETPTDSLRWSLVPKYQPETDVAYTGLAGVAGVFVWALLCAVIAIVLFRKNFIYTATQHA